MNIAYCYSLQKFFLGGSDAVGGSALQTAIDSNIAGSTPEWLTLPNGFILI